jgi:hypothetical protein
MLATQLRHGPREGILSFRGAFRGIPLSATDFAEVSLAVGCQFLARSRHGFERLERTEPPKRLAATNCGDNRRRSRRDPRFRYLYPQGALGKATALNRIAELPLALVGPGGPPSASVARPNPPRRKHLRDAELRFGSRLVPVTISRNIIPPGGDPFLEGGRAVLAYTFRHARRANAIVRQLRRSALRAFRRSRRAYACRPARHRPWCDARRPRRIVPLPTVQGRWPGSV